MRRWDKRVSRQRLIAHLQDMASMPSHRVLLRSGGTAIVPVLVMAGTARERSGVCRISRLLRAVHGSILVSSGQALPPCSSDKGDDAHRLTGPTRIVPDHRAFLRCAMRLLGVPECFSLALALAARR